MKARTGSSSLWSTAGRASDRIPACGHGRLCAAPGCTTLLSVYNPGPFRSEHDAIRPSLPKRPT